MPNYGFSESAVRDFIALLSQEELDQLKALGRGKLLSDMPSFADMQQKATRAVALVSAAYGAGLIADAWTMLNAASGPERGE